MTVGSLFGLPSGFQDRKRGSGETLRTPIYPGRTLGGGPPNHETEASPRQSYTYVLRHRILPEFGSMRMIDILPEHVREWVAGMKAGGVTAHTIRYAMVVLSAIFTTALHDQVTSRPRCRGVKPPPVPAQPRTIITPEQFAVLYGCLPDAQSKLLVETAVESGLR